MNDYVFHVDSVTVKKDRPTFLVVEGSCTQSMNRFRIEFCGTEARNVGAAMVPDVFVEKLRIALCEDYDYPAHNGYDPKAVANTFNNSQKRYGFDYDRE